METSYLSGSPASKEDSSMVFPWWLGALRWTRTSWRPRVLSFGKLWARPGWMDPAVWNLDHLGELPVFVGGLDSGASEICDLIAWSPWKPKKTLETEWSCDSLHRWVIKKIAEWFSYHWFLLLGFWMMLIFVFQSLIESDHPYCDCGKAAVSASFKFMQQDGIQ